MWWCAVPAQRQLVPRPHCPAAGPGVSPMSRDGMAPLRPGSACPAYAARYPVGVGPVGAPMARDDYQRGVGLVLVGDVGGLESDPCPCIRRFAGP
jgi:hypothetical protein